MSKHTVDLSSESERALSSVAKALGTSSEEQTLSALVEAVLHAAAGLPNAHHGAGPNAFHLGISAEGRRLRVPLAAESDVALISKAPDVMGGDTCIRGTRIPVWLLVEYKRQGLSDGDLLREYPGLNVSDLVAAWDHYAAHADEINEERRRHEEAA